METNELFEALAKLGDYFRARQAQLIDQYIDKELNPVEGESYNMVEHVEELIEAMERGIDKCM